MGEFLTWLSLTAVGYALFYGVYQLGYTSALIDKWIARREKADEEIK